MKGKIIEFTKEHIISVYFVITYLLSGILFLPYALFNLDTSGFVLPQLAPGISAILMVRLTNSRDGILTFIKKLNTWKVGLQWYIIAVIIPIIILIMRMVFSGIISDTSLVSINLSKMNLILSILPGVLIGAIGEEIGWRGFLLPVLQSRMNALKSSLVLGVLWGLFHFPIVIGYGIDIFLVFMVYVTLLSIVITWLYNNSKGSVIITILFHAVINVFTMTIFYSDINMNLYLAQMITALIIAGIILVTYGTKTFSKCGNMAAASTNGSIKA